MGIIFLRSALGCCLIAGFVGCARSQIKSAEQAMRPARQAADFHDDMEFAGLASALDANIQFLRKKTSLANFQFGDRIIDPNKYIKSIEALKEALVKDKTGVEFKKMLSENFEPFEVYGLDKWGEIFMTSYYEPVIDGARKPKGALRYPMYGLPKDLVEIEVATFQDEGKGLWRGRLIPNESGPARIVEYHDRQKINEGALKGVAPELFYVDPIDLFTMQIQGSGVVKLSDKKQVTVTYAGQNGHSYVPIGRHLFDIIPKEKMTLNAIESHLRSLPEPEAQKVMELNPSFVFFKPTTGAGLTFLGIEVVPGRTIATDASFFPKGALAYLEYEKPEFESLDAIEPREWKPSSRFVLDQDTGGAIKGPHRVDLFWGRGQFGKQVASVMKNKGRLMYLVPKPAFLESLN